MITPKFTPGNMRYPNKTMDGKAISVGQKVYQLTKAPDNDEFMLYTYEVTSMGNDGRISVSTNFNRNGRDYTFNNSSPANLFHTDATQLVIEKLAELKYTLEIELPQKKKNLETIIENLGIKDAILEVGDDKELLEI